MSAAALRIAEMTSQTFTVRSVQAFCYRYPLSTPVVTSFGRMLDRPAVFVRVEDEDGQIGWGEVWANFPSTGAEHRARLVNEVLAPAAAGVAVSEPSQIFEKLTQATLPCWRCNPASLVPSRRRLRESISRSGILYARRSAKGRCGSCSAATGNRIQVYASGINPTGSRQMAEAAAGAWTSRAETEGWFRTRRPTAPIWRRFANSSAMACWPPTPTRPGRSTQALEIAPHSREFDLAWLEEPIRADRPWQEWQALRKAIGRAAACRR